MNGRWTHYECDDRAGFDAAIAKLEAWNDRARANKSPWGPKVREYFTQINEPETTTEIEEKKENNTMTGTAKYFENDTLLDLIESVRATARNAKGTFTAEEMLAALTQAADPEKDNFNLNARRVNSTLATLSSHLGGFELTEISEHVYEGTHA